MIHLFCPFSRISVSGDKTPSEGVARIKGNMSQDGNAEYTKKKKEHSINFYLPPTFFTCQYVLCDCYGNAGQYST